MAMGIVSNKDFEKEEEELKKSNDTIPLPPQINDITPRVGRGIGNNQVPEALRKIIGEEANINGRDSALALARDFGIGPSSVSAYTKGATSTSSINNPIQAQLEHINRGKARVSKRAKAKLMMALEAITEEKIEAAKLSDISSVARDMSTIMKQMEPTITSNDMNMNNTGPTFVFYKPEKKSEDDYPTIHVRE